MSLSNSIDQISSQHKENVAVLFDGKIAVFVL